MNIEISNEIYLKLKNEILECYPKMNDDEIKKYLVDFISEDMTVKYFGGFVSMKETRKR